MAQKLENFASTRGAELAAEERLRREVETVRKRFEHASAEFEQVRLLAHELGLNPQIAPSPCIILLSASE